MDNDPLSPDGRMDGPRGPGAVVDSPVNDPEISGKPWFPSISLGDRRARSDGRTDGRMKLHDEMLRGPLVGPKIGW